MTRLTICHINGPEVVFFSENYLLQSLPLACNWSPIPATHKQILCSTFIQSHIKDRRSVSYCGFLNGVGNCCWPGSSYKQKNKTSTKSQKKANRKAAHVDWRCRRRAARRSLLAWSSSLRHERRRRRRRRSKKIFLLSSLSLLLPSPQWCWVPGLFVVLWLVSLLGYVQCQWAPGPSLRITLLPLGVLHRFRCCSKKKKSLAASHHSSLPFYLVVCHYGIGQAPGSDEGSSFCGCWNCKTGWRTLVSFLSFVLSFK